MKTPFGMDKIEDLQDVKADIASDSATLIAVFLEATKAYENDEVSINEEAKELTFQGVAYTLKHVPFINEDSGLVAVTATNPEGELVVLNVGVNGEDEMKVSVVSTADNFLDEAMTFAENIFGLDDSLGLQDYDEDALADYANEMISAMTGGLIEVFTTHCEQYLNEIYTVIKMEYIDTL